MILIMKKIINLKLIMVYKTMASEIGKVLLTAVGTEVASAMPNIIENALEAPDKYTGLEAVGYGIAKEAPWLDVFNQYPEAHGKEAEVVENALAIPANEQKEIELEKKIEKEVEKPIVNHTPTPIRHSTGTNPTPLHAPVIATSSSDVKPNTSKILNPFTNRYITMTELMRLAMKNDSEGLWAKRRLRKFKNKSIRKKKLLEG